MRNKNPRLGTIACLLFALCAGGVLAGCDVPDPQPNPSVTGKITAVEYPFVEDPSRVIITFEDGRVAKFYCRDGTIFTKGKVNKITHSSGVVDSVDLVE